MRSTPDELLAGTEQDVDIAARSLSPAVGSGNRDGAAGANGRDRVLDVARQSLHLVGIDVGQRQLGAILGEQASDALITVTAEQTDLSGGVVTLDKAIAEQIAAYERAAQDPDASIGLMTDLTDFDRILDGFEDGRLYIVDAGAKELIEFDLGSKARTTIASGLPVGAPPGVEPKPLKGMPPFSGPQGPFAGVTSAPDGTLYVSADSDGSVLAIGRR